MTAATKARNHTRRAGRRPSPALLVSIAFLSYVAIGLPGGVLGVAWPSIRTSFALSQDAIGALFLARTIGYFMSGFSNGRLVSRLGIGRFMALSSLIGALGVLGYALSPSWGVMVLCGLVAGIGTGAIDAGMNTYFAANHSPSLMNWLHAFFGLGAALGPVMTAAILSGGRSWRWSYVVVAATLGMTALCFALTAQAWQLKGQTAAPSSKDKSVAAPQVRARDTRALETLRLPVVWLSIVMFFVFTGLELSGGQWPYTLFTEARSIDPAIAGIWVSIYWASLTVGRILFGIAASRIRVDTLLRAAMLGCICGAALIWWDPADVQVLGFHVSFVGLALLGFSLAPIFPLSMSDTPRLIGTRHAPNAIGFQVAAASLGIAVLPGLAGVLAERRGLEVIGPFLLALAVIMLVLHEAFALVRAPTPQEQKENYREAR
jgi:fucose permease